MPKLPGIAHQRAVRALEKAGFRIVREGAKHIVMSNGGTFLTIPRHDPVNAYTMGGIIRDAGLTVEDFREIAVATSAASSIKKVVSVYPIVGPDVPFICNICGERSLFQQAHYFNPETPSCAQCRSNVRLRWLVHKLSMEFFGRSIPLPEFPSAKSITGLGLTDPEPLATELAARFNYRNTFLTTEPQFDIRFNPSPLGELDFLIASEVFEHVEPPVSNAFHNAAGLLKKSGLLLLTTPWVWDGDPATAIPELHDWKLEREGDNWVVMNRRSDNQIEQFSRMSFDGSPGLSLARTREHFPSLSDWKLFNSNGEWELINKRPDNKVEVFRNLVFHEGPGLALEMRLFTKAGIEENLMAAGFEQIEFEMQDTPEFGIVFGYPWSRPVSARKG